MVATRSQDQEPAKASEAAERTPDKRKRIEENSTITRPNPPVKKSKLEGSHSSNKTDSHTLAAVVVPTNNHQKARTPSQTSQSDSLANDGTCKPMPFRIGQERMSPSTHDERLVDVADISIAKFGEDIEAQAPGSWEKRAETKRSTPSTKFTSSGRRRSKRTHTMEPPTDESTLGVASAYDTSTQSTNAPLDLQHKRSYIEAAGLDDPVSRPNPALSKYVEPKHKIRDTESVPSDDEAPEVVTKSSGQQEARSAAAEATKAAATQRAAEKQKRRERDMLLKSQAKGLKKESAQFTSRKAPSDISTEDGGVEQKGFPRLDDTNWANWTSGDALPALLPDELLAAEPMARMPTPPLRRDVVKATVNTRRRFLDQASKPPKDIQRGSVRIRVLEDRRAMLPPKVSKDSKMLRESWLAGRLGSKGRVVMERRKISTGFVRR
ncbi:MAG: hypothetical protein Q9171_004023 [Xanthocarpia ochracea]